METSTENDTEYRRKAILDVVIIAFLILLLVTTSLAYYQIRSKGGQCIKGPFTYGAKQLAKQGFPFNTQYYILTEDGLKPASTNDKPVDSVNITNLESLLH